MARDIQLCEQTNNTELYIFMGKVYGLIPTSEAKNKMQQ